MTLPTQPRAAVLPPALDAFLQEYRTVLVRVGQLGPPVGRTPAAAIRALAASPFTLPDPLARVPGAASVAETLRQLGARRATLDAPPWIVERALIDALAAALADAVLQETLVSEPPPHTSQQARGPLGAGSEPSRSAMECNEVSEKARSRFLEAISARVPGLLGDDTSRVSPPAATASPTPARWFNAEFEDQPAGVPFEVGATYTLAFGVDRTQVAGIGGSAAVNEAALFPDGVEEVALTIDLSSEDLDIEEPSRPLRLPRTGTSRGKTRFDVTPRHNGPCALVAIVHHQGNFVQRLELTIPVGTTAASAAAPVTVTAIGRAAGASAALKPRNISLMLTPAAGGDAYDCIVVGAVSARARLRITPLLLAAAIEAARQVMMQVVTMRDAAGANTFQAGLDIPDAQRDTALRLMARAGARLFQQLFYGPGAGPDSIAVGDYLRRETRNPNVRLTLQIVAESTPVPWALLYVGDVPGADSASLPAPDPTCFLGLRHVIEQIPLQNTLAVADSAIASDQPGLSVSVNVNATIDAQFGVTVIADQQQFWADTAAACPSVRLTSRTTRAQLMQALANTATADQILYFYGHAQSTGVGAAGGPDASALVLSDGHVTLGDLYLDAPTRVPLAGSPLVFLNACESAELSPTFYDGFVPYFMAKGARGVIGTECRTPALFAAEWARRFFARFLAGGAVGDVVLALRQQVFAEHGNPLGLLYAVHCDSDTQIAPALTFPPPPHVTA